MNHSKSTIYLNKVEINISEYSDGSVNVTYPPSCLYDLNTHDPINIDARIKDSIGLLALIYLLDHLNNSVEYSNFTVHCSLDYFPNSRQDRTVNTGAIVQPFTLKTFCKILNSFSNVIYFVSDPHSNVIETLLNKVVVDSLSSLVSVFCKDKYDILKDVDYLISPDQGAYKKVKAIGERYNIPVLVADKVRNPETKEIKLSLNTNIDLTGKKVLILDDLVDFGNSIIELAKMLKNTYNAKEVNVFVSHAILPMNQRITPPSRLGAIFNNGYIDNFYCYNLFDAYDLNEQYMDEIKWSVDY